MNEMHANYAKKGSLKEAGTQTLTDKDKCDTITGAITYKKKNMNVSDNLG